jgi:hypothetical protein
MDNQENCTSSDCPYGYPPLFVVKIEITLRDGVRIVEYQNCGFKANVVFAKVLAVLVFVPFKLRCRSRPAQNMRGISKCQYICTHICTYIILECMEHT